MAVENQITTATNVPIKCATDPALLIMAQCLICYQTYNESNQAPIVLTCGHTYCRACIEKVTINGVMKCFECRAACRHDKGLKINKAILRVLKSMNLLATDDTEKAAPAPASEEMYVPSNADIFLANDKQTELAKTLATEMTEFMVEGDDKSAIDAAAFILCDLYTEIYERQAIILEDEICDYFVAMFLGPEHDLA